MKRSAAIFLAGLVGLFVFSPIAYSKDKIKTGVLEKNTFIDSAFGYSTSVPETWKGRLKNEPSLTRVAIEKSDVQINPRFSNERSNAGTRPRFLILADTLSFSPDQFLDRLFGEASWKGKGEYLKVLDWRPSDKEIKRSRVSVAGQPGVQLTLLRNMTEYFSEQKAGPVTGSEFRAEIVTVFRKDNHLFVAVLFSSEFFLESNFKDTMPAFADWKFLGQNRTDDSTSVRN